MNLIKSSRLIFKILILATVFITYGILAQDKKIESHKDILKNHNSDSVAVQALQNKAFEYYLKRDGSKSLKYIYEAGEMAKKIHDEQLYANTLGIKINILNDIYNNYPLALHYSFEQLKVFEKLKDPIAVGYTYTTIASIYDDIGDYESAVKYSKKALIIIEEHGLAYLKAWTNSSVGFYYLRMKNTTAAQPYFQKSIEMAKKLKDNKKEVQLSFSLYGLGKINWENNQKNIAAAYYSEALKHAKKNSGQDFVMQLIYIGIADVYQSKKMIDSATYYNKLALKSNQNKSKITLNIFRNLAELNAQSNPQQSVGYYDNFMRLNDSLFTDRKNKEIQNLTTNELERQREKAEKERHETEERVHNIQYAGIALVIFSFLLIVILLSHSFIVNEKWIEILGVIGLLLMFEFINLLIHPYVGELTHHSPIGMLLIMAVLAALLVPLHHKIEHWATHKMIAKNKAVRVAAAKKIIAKLEEKAETD